MKQELDWPKFNTERIGQLIMCEGGSCGNKDKGAIKVPIKRFKEELKKNGMKKQFKITKSECLGVCKPHNVSTIMTDEGQIWLGMFREEREYDILLKWIKNSVDNRSMLPLPQSLEKHQFQRFKELVPLPSVYNS